MKTRMIRLALLAGATLVVPMAAAHAAPTLCDGKVATVVGTSGPDVISGTPGPDVIAGLGGTDRILAGDGDDVICGGDGADRLSGEGGDDVIYAGKAQRYDSRAGNGYRPDVLNGGPGDDFLDIGREPVDHGLGISGVIVFPTAPAGIVVDLGERSATGDGSDTVVPRGGLRLIGTDSADELLGSDLEEEMKGGGGPDVIDGRGGDDRLYGDGPAGGEATDGRNDDRISGGDGKDLVVGTLGSDLLRGGPGLDAVRAEGLGPGQVLGGAGDDFLSLTLGIGDHVKLMGGPGRDDVTIDVHPDVSGPAKVLVNLGIGQLALDHVFVGRIGSTERLHMAPGVPLSFYGSPGRDEVYAGANGRLRAWTYDGNDVIWGSSLADRIDGGFGFDEVRAGRGRDTCLHAEQRRDCERP